MFIGNFTTEAEVMRNRFEERKNIAIDVVKKAMKTASRELWNCDPKTHEKSEKLNIQGCSNLRFLLFRPDLFGNYTTFARLCSK